MYELIRLTLGKRVSNYRNLSEFRRQIDETATVFCDRFGGILGANSSQFTVFAAIHTKSKMLILKIDIFSTSVRSLPPQVEPMVIEIDRTK